MSICRDCICYTCVNNFMNKENYKNPCEHCIKCVGSNEKRKTDVSRKICDNYRISDAHAIIRRRKREKIPGEKTL